jgi:hypothetical protein
MGKYSWQLAASESFASGVIRSLRCAVICCKRKKSEVVSQMTEGRRSLGTKHQALGTEWLRSQKSEVRGQKSEVREK